MGRIELPPYRSSTPFGQNFARLNCVSKGLSETTSIRFLNLMLPCPLNFFVRKPGIEPGPHAPLPVQTFFLVGIERIELSLHAPEACILPLYYIPLKSLFGRTCILPLYDILLI